MRPSGSARARLDFTDVESPDTKDRIEKFSCQKSEENFSSIMIQSKNKENNGETQANSQGNREKNLYHALMQNELQGCYTKIEILLKLLSRRRHQPNSDKRRKYLCEAFDRVLSENARSTIIPAHIDNFTKLAKVTKITAKSCPKNPQKECGQTFRSQIEA